MSLRYFDTAVYLCGTKAFLIEEIKILYWLFCKMCTVFTYLFLFRSTITDSPKNNCEFIQIHHY